MSPTPPSTTPQRLRLEPVAGPATSNVVIGPEKPVIIGRAVGSDVVLLHEGVSRRHAQVEHRANRWYISDLGSSPGTFINGMRLQAESPTALGDLDLLRIGPWTFRVSLSGSGSRFAKARTLDDSGQSTMTVHSTPLSAISADASPANQRLEQLIDCTLRLMDAPDPAAMAKVVLDAAAAGTGFPRGAVLRPVVDDDSQTGVEIVAWSGDSDQVWGDFQFSRTLLREASAGAVATLTDQSAQRVSQRTIGELGIHSAICAPVMIGSTVAALLYLDARAGEAAGKTRGGGSDAGAFCGALARMYGMALGNAMRADLEHRRAALELDLSAAREAQQLIMPPPDGVVNGVKYAVQSLPGRFVAGDLFDVVALPDGRVAVAIGDVSGEGAGSAILMAGTQAYLHGALKRGDELARAVNDLNQYVTDHSPLDRFVSLWVGVFDAKTKILTYVDAGHGHWMMVQASGPEAPEAQAGGIPLGIAPDYEYPSHSLRLEHGDRVVLFSDGLKEQESPAGDEFGLKRIAECLRSSGTPESDARALMQAVRQHAARPFLDDDTTVACVQLA